MRWKIKSIDKNIDEQNGISTTTTTKQLMVSVGDIVGVGKNAYGAVKAAAKAVKGTVDLGVGTFNSVKTSINGTKTTIMENKNPNLKDVGFQMFSSSISVLETLIKSMNVYKKVMSVVEMVTPISQLIARISGIFHSPGNAGDIAQIILGQAKKALISLAVSAVIKLKDFVWNYEFSLKEIKEIFEEPINKNIEDLNNKIQEEIVKETENDKNLEGNDADGIIGGEGEGEVDLSNIIGLNDDPNYFRKFNNCSKSYITEFQVGEYKRMLRGNLVNLGIQYSDDGGETWNTTNKINGSWKCFGKILNNGNYIYVCGGCDYILSVSLTEDESINLRKNYYNKNKEELSLYEKNNLSLKEIYDLSEDNSGITKSQGIYYSEDNGMTWTEAVTIPSENEQINDLCEFEEKTNEDGEIINSTIVASTNNYNGCYYTEDGKNWVASDSGQKEENSLKDKWLDVSTYDNKFRIVSSKDLNSLANKDYSNIRKLYHAKSDIIYQGYNYEIGKISGNK